MAKKIPKIHVMRRLLEVDTTIDPDSHDSLYHSAGVLTSICAHVEGLDHTTLRIISSGQRRVPVPKPAPETSEPEPDPSMEDKTLGEPTDDIGDLPDNLRRVPRGQADAAE